MPTQNPLHGCSQELYAHRFEKKKKQETARRPSMQEWLKKTVIHPYHEIQLSNEKELSMQDTFPA